MGRVEREEMVELKQGPSEIRGAKLPLFSPLSPLFSFVIFIIIWLFLLMAGRTAMFRDPGTFWHVAAGEKMLAEGRIVREDPFSFTRFGRPWVADQWLAECGMAGIYKLTGWDGLLLLTTAVLAGIYTWITARLVRGGLHLIAVCLLMAVAIMLGAPQFFVRPLVLSIGLLAVAFALLIDVESGAKSSRTLWWLVPLFIFWANVHGGYLGGLGTVALWSIGMVICDATARRFRDAFKLILLLLVLAATVLINPYGTDLLRHWLTTLRMPLPELIEEHAPLDLTGPLGWGVAAMAVFYTAALMGTYPRRPRVTWLVPVAWFFLALGRCRNASLFAVVAALALADVPPQSRVGVWLRRRGLLGDARPAVGLKAAVLPTLIVAAVLAARICGEGWGLARLDRERCPVELLPQLNEVSRSHEYEVPIFNDMNFGGFLMFHQPRMRVFVDDRCALYGADFLKVYDRARREDPARIESWRRQYGFRYALVESGGNFDRYLRSSGGWTVLDASPAATLHERRLGDSSQVR
ncbi:MAG: hypothetical protein JW959_07350 [Pirellulales bacterium]|nr:hypothetical protein [Pirellulales bacterium]